MELSFVIDGTVYQPPKNWDEISASIEYDSANQITTLSHDVTHVWDGDVYNLLYQRWLNGNSCEILPVMITNEGDTLFTGFIDVTKCSFNERRRYVEAKIIDDSFGARIENNKGARVSLDALVSKNGIPISATGTTISCFNPSDGSVIPEDKYMYSVHEAFSFLIKWMTDDTVGFESEFFDTSLSNNGSYDYLTSGINLRSNESINIEAPKFSFQLLFDLMRRLRNIGMGFKYVSGVPTVVIEHIDYFRSNTNYLLLENVDETILSFDSNILYTSIKVGSDILRVEDCFTNCNASNGVSYFGFETEYYVLNGECTTQTELTLTVDDPFIVDTNKIQETIEFNQDTYDDKCFLIHVDPSSPTSADKSDPLGIGENWYNEAYTNKEILARYSDYLSGTITLYNLYSGLNLFSVTGTSSSSVLFPQQTPTYLTYPSGGGVGIPMNVEIYDPQNTYDIPTDKFTPANEGVFRMCMGIQISNQSTCPSGIIVAVHLVIEKYNSGNILLDRYLSDVRTHVTRLATPIYEEWETDWIPMDSGDYLVFVTDYAQSIDPATSQAEIGIGGSFQIQYLKCCESLSVVQDAQVNGGQKKFGAITSFNYKIPYDDFMSFFQDTTKQIRITSGDISRTGYVNSLNYNFVTGDAEIEIISNE